MEQEKGTVLNTVYIILLGLVFYDVRSLCNR